MDKMIFTKMSNEINKRINHELRDKIIECIHYMKNGENEYE